MVHAGVRKAADSVTLERDGGQSLRAVTMDVTDSTSIAAAAEELKRRIGADGLSGLVNNAGVCHFGPVECVPIDEWRRQFEVNVFGQIAVTQAMLPLMREASGGAAIVMMSSIAGRIGQPILGPYCASKFALEAVADALRCEVLRENIRVSLVEPGAIRSEIWRKAMAETKTQAMSRPVPERYRALMEGTARIAAEAEKRAIPASRVARHVELCLTRRKSAIRRLIGVDAKMSAIMAKLMPRGLLDRLLIAVMTRASKKG
jgi:NAD(P)-dependent dehydrogenase (short-subunit alcohol dehydrogenase family)